MLALEADRKLVKKLEKQKKFDPILDSFVDAAKIKSFEFVQNWVENKLQELLGQQDEILIGFIMNILQREGQEGIPDKLDGKMLQVQVTGFLKKDAPVFTALLWKYLLDLTNPRPQVLSRPQQPPPPPPPPLPPPNPTMNAFLQQHFTKREPEYRRRSRSRERYRDRDRGGDRDRDRSRSTERYRRRNDRSRSRSRSRERRRHRSRSRSRSRSRERYRNRGNSEGHGNRRAVGGGGRGFRREADMVMKESEEGDRQEDEKK